MLGRNADLAGEILLSNVRRPPLPFKLTFAVTYRCNSRCATCGIWRRKAPSNELSVKEMDGWLARNNGGGFRWVAITGGEPFLRRDLHDICKSFNERCPLQIMTITTNCLIPKVQIREAKRIASLGIPRLVLTLSCDGPPALHDRIRGIPGSFEKVCEVYSALRHLDGKRLSLFFGMTISPLNVGKFEELYRELHSRFPEVGYDRLHVNLFHVSDHFYGNSGRLKERGGWKKSAEKEMRYVIEKRRFGALDPLGFLERQYLKGTLKYLESSRSPLPCLALSSSLFLEPQGDLYPCSMWDRKMANIRQEPDLAKLWKSAKFEETAKAARSLTCPQCWTPCEAYQTIAGNLLKAV